MILRQQLGGANHSLTPAGCPTIQLNSDVNYLETTSDPTGEKFSRTRLPLPAPIQMPIPGTCSRLCFCLTGYRSEVPVTTQPPLGSVNLVEWLTELRNILLTRLPVYYKRI